MLRKNSSGDCVLCSCFSFPSEYGDLIGPSDPHIPAFQDLARQLGNENTAHRYNTVFSLVISINT